MHPPHIMLRHPRPERWRGFTLIEILVVIVIIGVMAAVATVAIGVLGRDREVQEQAERLWAVVTQAREEAELQGRDLGLFLEENGYRFMSFDARRTGWINVEDDALLAARELPPGLRLRLWVESREVVLKEQRPSRAAEQKQLPQIVMVASGEIVPFRVEIERAGTQTRWHVFSQPDNNNVVVQQADAT